MVLEGEKGKFDHNLVSIIIPVYNRELFIKDTLLSIKNQTFENWEAIIIDDGSNDNSINIINDFVSKDKRFRFFHRSRSPKGAQTCRNEGMEKAEGKYIIFLDSDDLLAPYCLDRRVTYMEEHPELDFSVNHVVIFEKEAGDLNILWNVFNEEDDLLRFYSDDVPWQTTSPIWKRTFIKNLEWDEDCISGQDWDFHVNALSYKPSYTKLDGIPDCFIRRDHSVERISRNFFKGPQILNREKIWRKNYKILKEKKVWKEEYNKSLASFYFRFCEYFLLKIKNGEFNAFKFYSTVYDEKLLNRGIYLWTLLYLMGLSLLKNRKYLRKYFYKYLSPLMPEYLNSENVYKTQEQIKLEGKKLDDFIEANKSLNCIKE